MRPQLIMSGLTLVNAAVRFRKQAGHLRAASVTVCDARHVTHMTLVQQHRLCLLPAMSGVRALNLSTVRLLKVNFIRYKNGHGPIALQSCVCLACVS